MEMETITELVEGANLFDSRGYSIVKVTKEGKEKWLKLAIRSTGVAEYMENLRGKAPRPPTTFQVIKRDSPEGRELGLSHDRKIQVFDPTDERYVDSLEKHNQEFTWGVVIFALDMTFKTSGGTPAQNVEEKKRVLKSNGITWSHINKIFADVTALTKMEDERADFLPEN
jgi:hypothetical protein